MAQTSQAETAEGTGTPRSAQVHLSRLYLWAIRRSCSCTGAAGKPADVGL